MKTILVILVVAAIAASAAGKKKGHGLGAEGLFLCDNPHSLHDTSRCRHHCKANEHYNRFGACPSGEICCTIDGPLPHRPPFPPLPPYSDEIIDNSSSESSEEQPPTPTPGVIRVPCSRADGWCQHGNCQYGAEPVKNGICEDPYASTCCRMLVPPSQSHPSVQSSDEEPSCSDIDGICRYHCKPNEIPVPGYSCGNMYYSVCCVRSN